MAPMRELEGLRIPSCYWQLHVTRRTGVQASAQRWQANLLFFASVQTVERNRTIPGVNQRRPEASIFQFSLFRLVFYCEGSSCFEGLGYPRVLRSLAPLHVFASEAHCTDGMFRLLVLPMTSFFQGYFKVAESDVLDQSYVVPAASSFSS
ncbi:hypothetical protein K439DRAFT_474247 [Ramaria rubella]|nr:hypothetical protein K439DRAFT_474247 [Ramaria rubella]